MTTAPVRLTEFARGGGCAAKLRLGDLTRVLERAAGDRPGAADVLVDHAFSDDAAVLRATAGRHLVMTADVIAPLVDDPYTFGAIAATNAMSDVWAMGGEPRFALNLVFFADKALPLEVLDQILAGGAAACRAAGVAVVGGHSVCDPEVKFGLSVTGDVDPDQVWSNRTANPYQALILSKPLGTGLIAQAIKRGVATDDEIAAAVASMCRLNREAMYAGRRHGATAATDVTGFGLMGHLQNLLRGSGLAASVDLAALPVLPGALAYARAGEIPGGSKANRAFVAERLRWPDQAPVVAAQTTAPTERDLLVTLATDAQTSGGLLLCVPSENAAACVADLIASGHTAARIGRLLPPLPELPAQTVVIHAPA